MSRVWIPGFNGMLGKAFVQKLSGHEILTSRIDVRDTISVIEFAKSRKPEYIINCTGYTNVDGAETDTTQSWQVNVDGPMNLGIAGKYCNAQVLHFSTDYVFGGDKSSYFEADKPDPLNQYGYTKLIGENRFCTVSDGCFVIRTSWLFSEHGNNFVKTMLNLFRTKDQVRVVNDQFGRPTYAPYLADVSTQLLFDNERPSGLWHVANSGITSWYQFSVEIYRVAKELKLIDREVEIIPITTAEFPRKAVRPSFSVLETKRVEEHLGHALKPWKQSLRDCLVVLKELETK